MDWITIAVTGVAALATSVAAGAAVWVIFVYRKQVAISQEQVKVSQEQVRVSQEQTRLALDTLREMQETRDAQTAPYVVVYVELKESFVYLVMENLGQMMAENVSLSFDPPLEKEHMVIKMLPTFISDITPNLAPRQQIRTGFNGFRELLSNPNFPPFYKVTVRYRGGVIKKDRQETYILDVRSFENIAFEREEELYEEISKGVNPITNAVSAATRQMDRIKDQLNYGLATAAMMQQLSGWNTEDPVAYFKALVRGLASDWRAWQEMSDKYEDVLFKQRLHFVAQAIGILSLSLPLADHDLDHLRLLANKLGPTRKYIHRDEEDPLPEILRELAEIADTLKVQPI